MTERRPLAVVYSKTYRLFATPEVSEAEKMLLKRGFNADARRNYAVGIQHISIRGRKVRRKSTVATKPKRTLLA
jgi:hypothetical protein